MLSKTPCFIFLLGCVFSHSKVYSEETDFNKYHDAENRLKRDLLKQYSKDVLPPHNSTSPIVIFVDLVVLLIRDLDAALQTLTTENLFVLFWKDARLAWQPANYANIGDVRFPPDTIWKPDVHLYNNAKMDEMHYAASSTFAVLYNSGAVHWTPPITLYSLCMVDLKNFPFDKHTCRFDIGSWAFSGDNLDIALIRPTNDMNMNYVWNQAGEWEIVGSSAVKNNWIYECCNESYPEVTFSLTLQRRSPFYKAAIGCPIIAATILVLTTFWISPLTYHRFTLPAVAFFTTVALLMHLKSKLPAVGKDVPLIMIVCGTLLIISTMVTVYSVIFQTIAGSHKNYEIPEMMKKMFHNRIFSTLCITIPTKIGDDGKSNGWLTFFVVVDRLLFVICLIFIIVFATATLR